RCGARHATSQRPLRTESPSLPALSNLMNSTGAPTRRASSRPRSDATPRGSVADEPGGTSRKLPWLSPIRSLPVGASSDRTAGVISVAMAPDVSTNRTLPLCRAGASGYSSPEEPLMTDTSRPPRPTTLEIDLDAAAGNVRAVRQLVGPERKIFAVIKADGYGHGAAEMGGVFVANGADALGVADLAEGIRLRRRGISCPILVYPNSLPEAAPLALPHRLVPTPATPE